MKTELQALSFRGALSIFGVGALMLYIATHYLIPLWKEYTQLNALVVWFISGGMLVFAPLFVLAIVLAKKEGINSISEWKARYLLTKVTRKVWIYSILSSISIMCLMGLMVTLATSLIPDYSAEPSFMKAGKLAQEDLWILMIWGVFFFFNIMGEELFWRGYMWKRLQITFGTKTWMVNALGWSIFHLSFGWMLLITLLPILIIQPWVMQKTQNTWSGIIIHALVNGIGFLMVTLVGLH